MTPEQSSPNNKIDNKVDNKKDIKRKKIYKEKSQKRFVKPNTREDMLSISTDTIAIRERTLVRARICFLT